MSEELDRLFREWREHRDKFNKVSKEWDALFRVNDGYFNRYFDQYLKENPPRSKQ